MLFLGDWNNPIHLQLEKQLEFKLLKFEYIIKFDNKVLLNLNLTLETLVSPSTG